MVTKNDHDRDILNGTRATVTAHLPPATLVPTVGPEDRGDDRPAQGLTTEHTLVYGHGRPDPPVRLRGPIRGRSSNHLYAALDHDHALEPGTATAEEGRRGRTPGRTGHPAGTVGLDDPVLLGDLDRVLGRDSRPHLASPRLTSSPYPPPPALDRATAQPRDRSGGGLSLGSGWGFDLDDSHTRDDGHGLSR